MSISLPTCSVNSDSLHLSVAMNTEKRSFASSERSEKPQDTCLKITQVEHVLYCTTTSSSGICSFHCTQFSHYVTQTICRVHLAFQLVFLHVLLSLSDFEQTHIQTLTDYLCAHTTVVESVKCEVH